MVRNNAQMPIPTSQARKQTLKYFFLLKFADRRRARPQIIGLAAFQIVQLTCKSH